MSDDNTKVPFHDIPFHVFEINKVERAIGHEEPMLDEFFNIIKSGVSIHITKCDELPANAIYVSPKIFDWFKERSLLFKERN